VIWSRSRSKASENWSTRWETWFSRYKAFALHHADLAAKTGAQTLILGGEWVAPALPGGQINGGSSGVPADAETRWRGIISEVRARYGGSVFWALSYPGGLASAPAFVRDLDGVYLLWYAPLSSSSTPSVDDMRVAAGALLDNEILISGRNFQSLGLGVDGIQFIAMRGKFAEDGVAKFLCAA
jgi:hypothetical protein